MKNFVVFLVFITLVIGLTFPLFFKINTHILGCFETSEAFVNLWAGWQFKYAFVNKLDIGNYAFISYPFGPPKSVDIVFPIGIFVIKWLSILTNEVLMYNFIILVSFLLSGYLTFLLVKYLSHNYLVGIFSGIIYSFCPYHFMRSWQHFGLAQTQWIPLYFLALLRLHDNRTIKNSILVILTFYLISLDYTYTYFMVIATTIFVLFILLNKEKDRFKFLRLLGIISALDFLLTLPATYIVYKNYFFGVPKEAISLYYRPFSDLFSQSARPLSYFLPSVFHPILGHLTQMFIGSGYYGKSITEHTLYLGWVPLILAVIAFSRWLARRSPSTASSPQPTEENFYIGFFVLLAIVAWFFSQPPWWRWGTFRIYMPSFFMYKILPMFRAYCRFGIVVMLAVSVLAGFGLKLILERYKSLRVKIAVTALFCGLVLFEFWNYPPFKVIDLTKYPKVYDWLRVQPDHIVIAEYPLDLNGANEMYKFYQTKHHKRIINATIPGTYANKVSQALKDISDYRAAEGLKWLGVDYVLVHSDSYKNNENFQEKEQMENIGKNKVLKLVKQIDEVSVYQVIASAVKPDIK